MKRLGALCLILFTLVPSAWAHVGDRPSIHDTMAGIIERLRDNLDFDELRRLRPDDVMPHVTAEEKEILASEYWSFDIDQPATLWVFRYDRQPEMPYWIEDAFEKTEVSVEVDGNTYEGWRRDAAAGTVGLGLNGFRPIDTHYFVVLQPKNGGPLAIENMYPGQHKVGVFEEGAVVHLDDLDSKAEGVPESLNGAVLVRAIQDRAEETELVGVFRATDYPAAAKPDQIVLTWNGDPKTTQAVQWRTSTSVDQGQVWYRPKGSEESTTVAAVRTELKDRFLVNDPVIHRFTATMTGLEPATEYEYRVGDPDGEMSSWMAFTTAPAETVPFTFVYMGDAQNGLDTWGKLVHKAFSHRPDAAFYVMAGDLVNRGNERDDWDSFFHNAEGIYDQRQLVPAIGNHEDQGDHGPWMYLELFGLPTDGPEEIPAERAYTLEYSNALFVILDTNLPVHDQTDWLEEQLANSDATWKFVVYHHPAYSSAPRRDNPLVRRHWGALFDKYHVDMALQGHDHAYLRTPPMRDGKPAESPAEGTIYVVSVSGTKYYDQADREYIAKGMTNTSTYQVLDLRIDGDKLTYRAYGMMGELLDEVVIEK